MSQALAIGIQVVCILALLGLLIGPHFMFRFDWNRLVGIWRELRPQDTGLVFSQSMTADLPEPVQRYFHHALTEGSSVFDGTTLQIRGRMQLKAGGNWQQFESRERIRAGHGLLWPAHMLMGPLWIIGRDCYYRSQGSMQWWLMGMLRVAKAQGPAVDESAAGRMAAEMIWLPGMLLPQFGNEWAALTAGEIICGLKIDNYPFELRLLIDDEGAVRAMRMQRLRNLDGGGSELQPFGMDSDGDISAEGSTVPGRCRVAWQPDDPARRFEFWQGELTELTYKGLLAANRPFDRGLLSHLR
jgi:hypothetical protein